MKQHNVLCGLHVKSIEGLKNTAVITKNPSNSRMGGTVSNWGAWSHIELHEPEQGQHKISKSVTVLGLSSQPSKQGIPERKRKTDDKDFSHDCLFVS